MKIDDLFYKTDKKTGKKRASKVKLGLLCFFGLFVLLILFGLIGALIGSGPLEINGFSTDFKATINKNTTTYAIKGEIKTIIETIGQNNLTQIKKFLFIKENTS